MLMDHTRAAMAAILIVVAVVGDSSAGESGSRFIDHGVAVPMSFSRGTVATVDRDGRNIVLVWLADHRGCYALLKIDAATGESTQYAVPFPPGGDSPYASILSSRNRYYTHFNSYFVEFDVLKMAFTFYRQTTPQMAMSMTEDDQGVIWSATYPQSGVVSFDPATGEFKDFGQVYKQNWAQYPRFIAADDKGWLYFAIGNTASQIIAFDPMKSEIRPMLSEQERRTGMAYLYRDMDGRVYGKALQEAKTGWYEFYQGKGRKIGTHNVSVTKPFASGAQGFIHRPFPDGKKIVTCDLAERVLVIEDAPAISSDEARIQEALQEHIRGSKAVPGGARKELHFTYTTQGSYIMSVAAAPDGTICGGTTFPMYFFSYNPKTDTWLNRPSYGQWNAIYRQDASIFVGGYTNGVLLEWEPSKEWVPTEKNGPGSNPRYLSEGYPAIDRPGKVIAYPDSETVVLAGTPAYGATGGGLLFWNRKTRTSQLVPHDDIIPDHSTKSLLALPLRNLLGGTTTAAGTGGAKKAIEAELYVMNLDTKKILWHRAVLPGIQEYSDLCAASSNLVYGIADRKVFFVFDTAARKVVHQSDLAKYGTIPNQQGPRIFLTDSDQKIYILFTKGIARIEPETHAITWLADSPVSITSGGDSVSGRIYFGSGSHLYSFDGTSTPSHKQQ